MLGERGCGVAVCEGGVAPAGAGAMSGGAGGGHTVAVIAEYDVVRDIGHG